jgi:hypothetical protein
LDKNKKKLSNYFNLVFKVKFFPQRTPYYYTGPFYTIK